MRRDAPVAVTAGHDAERSILERVPAGAGAPALFILGSPRTGSTFLYQALCSTFMLPYIDNLTNRAFATTPIVGLLLGWTLRSKEPMAFTSSYGKVEGLAQPSEGSALMAHWFGGAHPSQVESARILPGREAHLRDTLAAVHFFLDAPLAIKNAWNCFRVDAIAAALPDAAFVWIRRDIRAAAKSDLAARYSVQKDPRAWNSATPANVDELRKRPPAEQVVENQFEFGRAIASSFAALPPGRRVTLWYEDLLEDPRVQIARIGEALSLLKGRRAATAQPMARREGPAALSPQEAAAVDRYVEGEPRRFADYTRSR